SFTFAHDTAAGTLTLTSANLGEPMVYHRISGSASAKKEKDDDKKGEKPSDKALSAKVLHGRWSTPTPNGTLDLDLRADKSFTMAAMHGAWVIKGDRLSLKRSPKEVIEYRARMEGEKLLLSGGDLDEEVAFSRVE